MKYTKKPVEIDAIQLLGTAKSIYDVNEFIEGEKPNTKGTVSSERWEQYVDFILKEGGILIKTLESKGDGHFASFGDFIIRGVKGEVYACKPDIFEMTYSAAQPKSRPNLNLPEVEAALKSLNSANVHRSVQDMMMNKLLAAFGAIEANPYQLANLVNLQSELGYVKGEVSTVAMLGLVGEAGETLAECERTENGSELIDITVHQCKMLDGLKKRIRNGTNHAFVYLKQEKEDLFDKELADTFYYLQILATNRGLTILDLAQMAHDKVRAKQAAGGSSEDKK